MRPEADGPRQFILAEGQRGDMGCIAERDHPREL
jgi:hypothetical protein